MLAQPSFLGLVACLLYAIAATASWRASREARGRRQQLWHVRTWSLVAAFFFLLIVSRLLGLEEFLRAELREFLRIQGLMSERRSIQGPIIAVALIVFTSIAMLAAYRTSQRISGRRNIAVAVAIGACGVMVATIAFRSVSLHALDWFLNGPLKLNWVGDVGAAVAVLSAALIYVRIVSGKTKRRR